MGEHRSLERWAAAAPALPSDAEWIGARRRSLRELRSRCSSMNGHDIFAALPAAALSEPWLRQIDRMASSLIRHAAHNTPPSLQARLEEEWMAEMAGRTGRIARLLLALGCWWAASVIAREWAVSGVAATTPGSRST